MPSLLCAQLDITRFRFFPNSKTNAKSTKENMTTEHCVLKTINCLFFIGRFYGMTTFSFDSHDYTKIRVTFIDVLLLIGFLIFYLVLLVLNFTNKIEFLDPSFTIFNTGIRYLILYAITMVVFSVCFNFLFRNKLWNIILKVISVDKEVSQLILVRMHTYFQIILYFADGRIGYRAEL